MLVVGVAVAVFIVGVAVPAKHATSYQKSIDQSTEHLNIALQQRRALINYAKSS